MAVIINIGGEPIYCETSIKLPEVKSDKEFTVVSVSRNLGVFKANLQNHYGVQFSVEFPIEEHNYASLHIMDAFANNRILIIEYK